MPIRLLANDLDLVAEFDFHYNNRIALGTSDMERAEILAKGIVGKRLTYRRPFEVGRA
jgi:hypothetical protein